MLRNLLPIAEAMASYALYQEQLPGRMLDFIESLENRTDSSAPQSAANIGYELNS